MSRQQLREEEQQQESPFDFIALLQQQEQPSMQMQPFVRSGLMQMQQSEHSSLFRLQRLEQLLASLQAKLAQFDSEKTQLPMQLEELKVLFDRQASRLTHLQAQFGELHGVVAELHEAQEQLTQWQEIIRKLTALMVQLPSLHDKLAELTPQAQLLREKLAALPQLSQALDTLNEKLLQLQTTARESVQTISRQVSQLPTKSDVTTLQAQLKSLDQKQTQQITQVGQQLALDAQALQARIDKLNQETSAFDSRLVGDCHKVTAWANTHTHSHGSYRAVVVTDTSNMSGKVFWCEVGHRKNQTGAPTPQLGPLI